MIRHQVTFCEYRCDLCSTYMDHIDIFTKRITLRTAWRTLFDFDVPEEHIMCVGCKNDENRLNTKYQIRLYATEKRNDNCSFCNYLDTSNTFRFRADVLDGRKKKFAGTITGKLYKLFFRYNKGKIELLKRKKRGDVLTYKKKSWQEKLVDKENFPKILQLQKNFPCYTAVHKMGVEIGDDIILVNPSEIVTLMKRVPKGKLITLVEICKAVAQNHHVKGCCSLTTGIFIMTAANAAEEAASKGKPLHIPYWRTLKVDGFLNEKYPGGALNQKKLLEQEGFTVLRKGKKFMVKDYEKYLTKVK